MSRAMVVLAILIAISIAVLAIIFVPGWLEEREARQAIVAYDVSLSDALRKLEPELLAGTAADMEIQRVASYITLLWGNGIALDSTLQSLDIESVESEGSTVTVLATEVWRYQERDRSSGESVSDVVEEATDITYILVRGPDGLIVWRSSVDGGVATP